MVFKLVRTDSAEPCKIELPTGKHLIGRGRLFNCDDKRVSRNHGDIEVTDNTVTIYALHENPFFIKKKGNKETQILNQNSSIIINNGDRFGLLPDSYWYELMYCANTETATDKVALDPECNQDTSSSESGANLEIADLDSNNTLVNNSPESPSLLTQQESSDTLVLDNHADIDQQRASSPSANILNQQAKRQHSSSDETPTVDVKKIKAEVKEEPDTPEDGPSNGEQMQQNADDNAKVPQQQQGPPQNPRSRERCLYGADCYRRNVQHKAEFSHPSDADWGAGERSPCPWGASCRRRDPRHYALHSHPAAQPRPLNAQRQRKRKKSIQRSDSDDSEDGNHANSAQILQGKRVRKTIFRPSYKDDSESEKEDDPYKTDGESDEWQPGTSDDWQPSNE
ncbi:hypothetical protein ACJJTC_004513 [Scirpophaga incertulas]